MIQKTSKKPNLRKRRIISFIILIAVIIMAITGIYHQVHLDKNFYLRYRNPQTVTKLRKDAKQLSSLNRIEYDIAYKPGCPDCKRVLPTFKKVIPKISQTHSVMFINASNPKIAAQLRAEKIHSVPTIVVKYRGFIGYQYSGTNRQDIATILNGINPDTNTPFDQKAPGSATYRDDTGSHNVVKQSDDIRQFLYTK